MEDRKLTDHFSLFELTVTDRPEFQAKNREVSEDQIKKLTELAHLLEHVRAELETPLIIHSGFRCSELNTAVGSTYRSQHLLCEAADFLPGQQDIGTAFRTIWRLVKDRKIKVGQVIHETAQRFNGSTSWIHISVGEPYRPQDRCQQVLRMQDGKYTMLA